MKRVRIPRGAWIAIAAVASLVAMIATSNADPPAAAGLPTTVRPRASRAADVRKKADDHELAYKIRFKLIESEGQFLRPGARVRPGMEIPPGKDSGPEVIAPPPSAPNIPARPEPRGGEIRTPAEDARAIFPNPVAIPPATAPRPSNEGDWDAPPPSGTHVLSAPTLELLANTAATIEMHTHQAFTFLEPVGDNRYAAKVSELFDLGMAITIFAKPGDGGDTSTALCKLEFQTSAMVGREPVEGLDLEVGKPIVSSWSLKTTATVKLGTTTSIVLPAGPGQEAVLLMKVTRSDLEDEPGPPAAAPKR